MSAEFRDSKTAASKDTHRWWLFTACVLVSLTNELSTAVTNLSLGPMRRDLDASSAVMQMAVTLGKLMLGAFMLAGGVAGGAGRCVACGLASAGGTLRVSVWWASILAFVQLAAHMYQRYFGNLATHRLFARKHGGRRSGTLWC